MIASRWHQAVAIIAIAALGLQVWLVITGSAVLVEGRQPGLWLRLGRCFSYFTIQSNLLIAAASVILARNPTLDGRGLRVLRTAGLAGIAVTGLVHFFLLRPLLDLHGWSWVTDKLLHLVVPILAVGVWLVFGPRPRTDLRAIGWAFLWPLVWLVWTLAMGAATGWFPYPFLDFDAKGWGSVIAVSCGITALFAALFALAAFVDRRLRPAPSY